MLLVMLHEKLPYHQLLCLSLQKSCNQFSVKIKVVLVNSLHIFQQYKQQFSAKNQAFDEKKHDEEIKTASSKTVKWHLIREQII